jgi:folylpolyglutamate synthase/dihydropteroate synthase
VAPGAASEVIRARAQAEGCRLTLVHRDIKVDDPGLREGVQMARIDEREYKLGLNGPHQVFNAACAVGAMRQIGIPDPAVKRGLDSVVWPGRFEVLSGKPLIVLDGAHNPAAVAMLVETWRAFLSARFGWSAREGDGRAKLVFASVAEKDISEMAQLLQPLAREVWLLRLANERAAEPAQLAPAFAGTLHVCYDSVSDAWRDMTADRESIFLITGSLFLVGEMLARRYGNTEEYNLNERLEKVLPIR